MLLITALEFLSNKSRTAAPQTPRVVLLGPTGCGKSFQAARLAAKYNLVNVCMGKLVKEQIAEQSKIGTSMKLYVERKIMIPDALVLNILVDRLSRLDCMTRGWILHGYPLTQVQYY